MRSPSYGAHILTRLDEASRDLIRSNKCNIMGGFSNSYLLPLWAHVSVKLFKGIDLKSNSLA